MAAAGPSFLANRDIYREITRFSAFLEIRVIKLAINSKACGQIPVQIKTGKVLGRTGKLNLPNREIEGVMPIKLCEPWFT
jgi:hypothetical protein